MVALAIRLLVIVTAPSITSLDTGDYALYDIGARHFLQYGDFSNSLFLVRPPVYPLLLAALALATLQGGQHRRSLRETYDCVKCT